MAKEKGAVRGKRSLMLIASEMWRRSAFERIDIDSLDGGRRKSSTSKTPVPGRCHAFWERFYVRKHLQNRLHRAEALVRYKSDLASAEAALEEAIFFLFLERLVGFCGVCWLVFEWCL